MISELSPAIVIKSVPQIDLAINSHHGIIVDLTLMTRSVLL